MTVFSNWLRADNYREKRGGVEFPEAIGSYKREKIAPYEAGGGKTGVAIGYRSEDADATIYIRDSTVGEYKTSEEFLEDSLRAIKALEAQGHYSNIKIYQFSAD
jgi:hypothetical protein